MTHFYIPFGIHCITSPALPHSPTPPALPHSPTPPASPHSPTSPASPHPPTSLASPISSNNFNFASPKKWDDIFNDGVEKDDTLWKEYLEEAAKFDRFKIDEWNKIVDVVLLYVALFISVLTAFILETSAQFHRDPADISNDLLVAIYHQLAAQSSTISAPIIDPASFFTQDKMQRQEAVVANALLYCSLAVSAVVSIVALTTKLWLISYNNRVSSTGSAYERAMKRQVAYNGALAWKLDAIINALPLMLLVSLFMFATFIHQSISDEQTMIGYFVGFILILGLEFILVTSIAAAFIPSAPFHSSLSISMQLIFKIFPDYKLSKRIVGQRIARMNPGPVRIAGITLASIASLVVTVICVLRFSSAFYALFCFPIAGTFALAIKPRTENKKPQKYGFPHLILLSFLTVAPTLIASGYYCCGTPQLSFPAFISLFVGASILLVPLGLLGTRLSDTTGDSKELDAIAWFMMAIPESQKPSYFRKAGQIASSPRGRIYDAHLLASLLPLLSPLISSHRIDKLEESEIKDLEIYVACLARLSDFENYDGSFWANEDASVRPILQDSLKEKIVDLAKMSTSENLRDAATKVLDNYGLNKYGEEYSREGLLASA